MSGFLAGSGIETGAAAQGFGRAGAALMLGALLFGVAVVFLALAAFLGLSESFEPWLAALIVAGVALPLAALLLFYAARKLEATTSQVQQQVQQAVRTSAVATFAPVAIRLLARNAGLAAAIAALGGVVLALLRRRRTPPAA